jgi:hypothetical protein
LASRPSGNDHWANEAMGRVRPVSGGGNHNFDTVQKTGAALFDGFGEDFLKALSDHES